MDLQLQNKSVLISGSTSGIGFAVAEAFLAEGASVIINGRSEESLKKAIDRLRESYPSEKIQGVACDFSSSTEVEYLCRQLSAVDILINNVGIYRSQSFWETGDEDWRAQIEVNLMSGLRLSRHFLPRMIERNWGRVIFVSSECATLVPADLIAYSSTKAAMLAVSRGLAQLTRATAVTVNTVLPGSTMTEGAEIFLKELAGQQKKSVREVEQEFFREQRPSSLLQRFTSVKEVAHTIVYLASPLAAATNGAAIKLDGGSMGGIL
ncbi:MAG: SDR family oxidoreductase [Bacteroidia bacterium]|nr:SDR family oxidoreductase [Bacteroidia bacterium]